MYKKIKITSFCLPEKIKVSLFYLNETLHHGMKRVTKDVCVVKILVTHNSCLVPHH